MNPQSPHISCPLCADQQEKQQVQGKDTRRYFLCPTCRLIFIDPASRLTPEAEKSYYGTHENSIEQPGYVRFLQQIITPTLAWLRTGMRGLDYGCGPGPTLSELLRREGMHCDDYDPLFRPQKPQGPYDFIFSTECFEHFYEPVHDIQQITELLKQDGILAVMTEQWQDLPQFRQWYYTTDPSHSSYFHRQTMDYVAARFSLQIIQEVKNRIIIFRKL
ncbi:class I SAM-dependent methyltransferase [Spirochaeta dissipatitropha]